MAESATDIAEALWGRYSLERELGRGGMATVHLARDLKHDRLDSVARAWTPRTYAVATDIAKYHALAGDAPAAARWYERSRGIQGGAYLPSAVFDQVRDSPEFRAAVARVSERNREQLRVAQARSPRR